MARACFKLCIRAFVVFIVYLSPLRAFAAPITIMDPHKMQRIKSILPPIADQRLRSILFDPNLMWYDRESIVPGYQDSWGDNTQAPIGFRPNSIARQLIDTAVPGGHAQLFIRKGEFHFPFGRTGGVDDALNTFVVDFWLAPRLGNQPLPVVWWKRTPSQLTHRYEWMFPKGTVLGEILVLVHPTTGQWYVFEIRTRERLLDRWTVDAYRPFPRATDFATALDERRHESPKWEYSVEIMRLIWHLRDYQALEPARISGSHYQGAFTPVDGWMDWLPSLKDTSILEVLLRETPFSSAKGIYWKKESVGETWAATTKAEFSIVPKNYNAGLFEVSDQFCSRCHQDAGRPFRDYYKNVLAYGELWGEDESFSWHPFETSNFVDSNGDVVNFNYDNRRFRSDFVAAGLVSEYNQFTHPSHLYRRIFRDWKDYAY